MTPVPRTLTARELNRAVLARQLLLERSSLAVPRALERMAFLQAQYSPAMYLGLWSRVDGLHRAEVTALLEKRAVVQGTLLRATIHLVSARDYWPAVLATRETRRLWLLRAHKRPAEEYAAAADVLRAALAGGGALRQTEIDKLIGPGVRAGVGQWLDLVRIPPSGTWERRRADLYGLAEDWLGPPPSTLTDDDGVELLLRRYLGGFGPATRGEIADWAGLTIGRVAPVLDRLRLQRFLAEDGAELLDLPGAPLPPGDTPAPVRFLPVWDASLLAHARRARILPEEYRPRIFSTKTPHSFNTVLVDGAVAGTWRFTEGRVVVDEFAPLDAPTRKLVADEAARLESFHS